MAFFILLAVIILNSCFLIQPASAAVGVSPAKLELKNSEPLELFLQGLSDRDERVEIKLADQDLARYVEINPDKLIVRARETASVQIKASGKNFATELEITTLPEEDGMLRIGSGVRIPLKVKSANANLHLILPLSFALSLTGIIFFKTRKKT